MYACSHVQVRAYVITHTWKPEDTLKHCLGTIYFVFETVPLTGLEPAKSAKLAGQWAAACCSFRSAGIASPQHQIQLFNVGPGDLIQVLVLIRQATYELSYLPSLSDGIFETRSCYEVLAGIELSM